MPRATTDGLTCPRCGSRASKVIRTITDRAVRPDRSLDEWNGRTRQCTDCKYIFTTKERIDIEVRTSCIDAASIAGHSNHLPLSS